MTTRPRATGSVTTGRPRAGALGALALGTDLAHDALLGTTRGVHEAVTRRVKQVDDLVGGHRTTVHTLHGGISGLVYDGIGGALRATTNGLRAADPYVGARLEDSARGRSVVSILNGIFGDRIAERHPEMAIDLRLRHDRQDLPVETEALRAAYTRPDGTVSGQLLVFVHGLIESESFWHRRSATPETAGHGSYGDRLAAEDDWAPLYLRVNTGLPIAENGVALASLLDHVVAAWPEKVTRIAFVGHSMGGLIVRRACAVVSATGADAPWNRLVSDVVTLGTPHLGAPIAQALSAGSHALSRLPESAPFGTFLDHRAAGIDDLRSALPPDVRNLPHARYRLVGATLARSRRHPVSELAGDLLVRYPSAVGRTRRGRELFPGAATLHVPGADHFDLLNHEDVYAALRGWLAEPRPEVAQERSTAG